MAMRFPAAAGLVFLLGGQGLLWGQGLPAAEQGARRSEASVSERRASHLRHGVNLSGWFAQLSGPAAYTKEHFETAITQQDLALIGAMGFDHVRLCVDPRPMFHEGQADEIASEYLNELDAAIKMLLDQGLAVDIDMQADSAWKQRLATSDDFVEEYADFWRALARHWSALDPERVFFEILNEPELRDRYRWSGVQSKLADAIRQGAPRHTIIATGAHWSDDDDLVFLEPLRDNNVIYTFHFYQPQIFTHQGATWSVNYWHYLKGVPYPSEAESAKRVAEAVPDPANRLAVVRYGMDHWNAARIDAEIGQVADWAKNWGVTVLCNEFGAYRKNADPEARARWLTDVRGSLDAHGVGWTTWDYDGGFGVVTRENGRPVPDEMTLRALGRKTPAGGNER
jgi:endoglucanase